MKYQLQKLPAKVSTDIRPSLEERGVWICWGCGGRGPAQSQAAPEQWEPAGLSLHCCGMGVRFPGACGLSGREGGMNTALRPQNLVRWCDSSPCKNGGKCWQTNVLYRCECHSGWTGLYCDVPSVSCEAAARERGTRGPLPAQAPPAASPGREAPASRSRPRAPRRHRRDPPVPERRALLGRGQHAPLPLPAGLHGQLLRGPGGRVLAQPLPERSHLHRLPRRLLLRGGDPPGEGGRVWYGAECWALG